MTARLALGASATAAAAFVAIYLGVVLLRIAHPYELEWEEGMVVDHALRVLDGKALYAAPTLDWIPSLYPPLYFWCGAGAVGLFGEGFWPLRLLSFVASLGALLVLFELARRETGSRAAGVLAAGAFAATFRASGAWLDLARVDSLALCLSLIAVLVLRWAGHRPAMIVAGALAALAFLGKQTSAMFLAPVFLWALWSKPRAAVWACATAAVLIGVPLLWLHVSTEGWYGFYVFELPASHAWLPHMWGEFWTDDIGATVPWLAVAALFSRRRSFWLALLAGGIAAAWPSRLHEGGWYNVLLFAYAPLAAAAASGVHRLAQSDRWRVVAAIACIAQLAWLAYDPRLLIPTAADREAGDRIVAEIRAVDGDVLVLNHGFLARLAGKRGAAHFASYGDVIRADVGATGKGLRDEMSKALRGKRWSALLLDTWTHLAGNDVLPGLLDHYTPSRFLIPHDSDVFKPVTGGPARPIVLYLPK